MRLIVTLAALACLTSAQLLGSLDPLQLVKISATTGAAAPFGALIPYELQVRGWRAGRWQSPPG